MAPLISTLRFEYPFEFFQRLVQLGAQIAVQFALLENVSKDIRMLRLDKRIELLFVFL